MEDAVVVAAVRTPIGRHGGVLSAVRPDDLAPITIKEVVTRAGVDPSEIEEVYIGCANQAGEDNRNIARMASILAGLPVDVAAVTFNRLCASGLTAINAAARAIKVGEGAVFVAGGVQSMSRAPYAMPKSERSYPFGNVTVWDTTLGWRFPNRRLKEAIGNESMGETAENVWELTEITREEQDLFALESHQRAVAAIESGRFQDEIVPVTIPHRKGDPLVIDRDEHPRPDTSLEKLGHLRPAFRKNGTVTAGNASGINDGSSAVLLMSATKAAAMGLKPLARIVSSAAAGVPPRTMGLGPVPAVRKASTAQVSLSRTLAWSS